MDEFIHEYHKGQTKRLNIVSFSKTIRARSVNPMGTGIIVLTLTWIYNVPGEFDRDTTNIISGTTILVMDDFIKCVEGRPSYPLWWLMDEFVHDNYFLN